MIAALFLVGVLFVVQTWVASMLVEDPAALIANGDPMGTAFYEAAANAGGPIMFIHTAFLVLNFTVVWLAIGIIAATFLARRGRLKDPTRTEVAASASADAEVK